jgi:hypothetical protein
MGWQRALQLRPRWSCFWPQSAAATAMSWRRALQLQPH